MRGDWKEAVRRAMEPASEGGTPEVPNTEAGDLRSLDKEWVRDLGIGRLTTRFLLETDPPQEPEAQALEERLVQTMRQTHELRRCSEEVGVLWVAAGTFGGAIQRLLGDAGGDGTTSAMTIDENARPQDLGVERLKEIARSCGFLKVFCLVARALEQDFVTQRDRLVAEGLPRTSPNLSEAERQKQARDVASALLVPQRDEALDLLERLAR